MKKRHLKKWVKFLMLVIFTCSSILLLFFLFNYSSSFKKKQFTFEKEVTNNNLLDDNDIQDNLERFVYKDGFYSEKLSSAIKERIIGKSFPTEFNDKYTSVSYDDLRYLRLKYKDFSGVVHDDGEMIVNSEVANEVLSIFYELYVNDYSIAKIKLVDEYNSSDELSMEDNNTSSFNYRIVEQGDKLSWHCFGLAIDVNPLYNPYIVGNELYPSTATMYVNRENDFIGKIDHNDFAYITFTKYGWKWGGDFVNSKDYQHFYKDIYDDSIRDVRS